MAPDIDYVSTIYNQPTSNGIKRVDPKVNGFKSLGTEAAQLETQSEPVAFSYTDSQVIKELFSESVIAKIVHVATYGLQREDPFSSYPEYVRQDGDGKYTFREASFWTCGFFPGSLYALLERAIKFPRQFPVANLHAQVLHLARSWSDPLHATAGRVDTHDLGFIFQPSLQVDWELTGARRSLDSVLTAAESLASRFDEKVGAIRSWDDAVNKRYNFSRTRGDFLVIIDSMCNLDLLYYAGHQKGDQRLIDIATTHAHKILSAIVRDDHSTCHLINFDAESGDVRGKYTNQGYQDWSTWTRGQAWAMLGFTQTYIWTKDPVFLQASHNVAEYFLSRLDSATHSHPYVPAWDFDAPVAASGEPLRDTSAGMVAANALLLLHQATQTQPRSGRNYLSAALRIAGETIDLSLSKDKGKFETDPRGELVAVNDGFDAILRNATVNNHEYSLFPYADTGLVYADYYFLEFGNKLCRMGLV